MDKHRAPRIEFRQRAFLELIDRRGFTGTTLNVSETGAFLELGFLPPDVTVGELGLLHPAPFKTNRYLLCKIVRITVEGIGFSLIGVGEIHFNTMLVKY
ncbi:MAG: PilZ domain-containing protein [Magnetococcales bacterium]|nr:PilZ domain-containing protein [Magnetococcales bacterium]